VGVAAGGIHFLADNDIGWGWPDWIRLDGVAVGTGKAMSKKGKDTGKGHQNQPNQATDQLPRTPPDVLDLLDPEEEEAIRQAMLDAEGFY